jgi:hypothetical protein
MFIGRIAEFEVEDRTPLLFYAGAYAAVDREQRLERVRTISFW